MEKRSRRRIRDLVAHPASQGLVANENRCARICMMARSANAPLKGRIQKRKTNNLQIITSGLQRTAGQYRSARFRHDRRQGFCVLSATRFAVVVRSPRREIW
jgi:two-component sensor histidine kinase